MSPRDFYAFDDFRLKIIETPWRRGVHKRCCRPSLTSSTYWKSFPFHLTAS
jgi:hypothetical protein